MFELIGALEKFATQTQFPNTLKLYKSRVKEEFQATLRRGQWNELTKLDPMVLSEADQTTFVNARPADSITLFGELLVHPSLGKYSPGDKFNFLESSGALMRVTSVEPRDGGLEIKGTKFMAKSSD